MRTVALLLSLVAFLLVAPSKTLALTPTPTKAQDTQATSSATPSAIVQYNLAFPGMLPDNPLYKLKVLRDKIMLALTNDPMKKIDFFLLQADKGILAAAMLVDKNKVDLASETAFKAEHNYTLLAQELWNLPKKPDEAFFKRLETAALKHQEVLASLIKRVPDDKRNPFEQVLDFSKRNWESVKEYRDQRSITK